MRITESRWAAFGCDGDGILYINRDDGKESVKYDPDAEGGLDAFYDAAVIVIASCVDVRDHAPAS